MRCARCEFLRAAPTEGEDTCAPQFRWRTSGPEHACSGVCRSFSAPPSARSARELLRGRLERRGRDFLDLARRTVYGFPGSPYRRLLAHAGCGYEKLTTAGMTFLDTDLIKVLEDVLPARFGGGPTHYQLVEKEGRDGRPLLRLLVHPAVGPVDPAAVANAFFTAIGAGSNAARVMELFWRAADLLRVERRAPRVGESGKILHLHQERSHHSGDDSMPDESRPRSIGR